MLEPRALEHSMAYCGTSYTPRALHPSPNSITSPGGPASSTVCGMCPVVMELLLDHTADYIFPLPGWLSVPLSVY